MSLIERKANSDLKRWSNMLAAMTLALVTVLLDAPVAESDEQRSAEPGAGGRLEIQVKGFDADFLADVGLEVVVVISSVVHPEEAIGSRRELPLDGTGYATAEVDRGGWTVTLLATPDRGARSIVASHEITVTRGDVSRVEFDLSQKVYSGQIDRRRVPGHVRLRLDAREDRALPPVLARTRPDGSFVAIVPRPGRYDATIWDIEEASSTVVTDVSFENPNEEVKVRLPSTRASGQVLASGGQPVSGAGILARKFLDREAEPEGEGPGGILTASGRSDDSGRFDLAGLMPGKWEIRARHGELRSDPVAVTVRADEAHGDVTLTLREGFTLHGRVLTSSGDPVPEAFGIFSAVRRGAEEMAPVLFFETDPEGQFDLTYDRVDADVAYMAVLPDELPVAVRHLPMESEHDLQITVPEESAEVRLLIKGSQARSLNLNRLTLVGPDGAQIALGHLTAHDVAALLRRDNATEVHIPRLAPGRWRIARFSTLHDGVRSWGKDPAQLPIVAEFSLRPLESKHLELRLRDTE